MRIGITGWRGFIGTHLASRLANPVLFQGDMRNLATVKAFVGECDRIYHLAGKNRAGEGEILANNLVSTGNLVLAVRQSGRNPHLVFASSTKVTTSPSSEYGFTKRAEEMIVLNGVATWTITRIPNTYGVQAKPFYNSVVATFAYQVAHEEEVHMSDPEAEVELAYIDTVVQRLLTPTLRRFDTCRHETLRVRDIYEYLTSRLGEHAKLKRCLDYYKEVKDVSSP